MAKRPVMFVRRPNPNLAPDHSENGCWVYGPRGFHRCPCVRSAADNGYLNGPLWLCTADGHKARSFCELENSCPFNKA